MLIIPYGNTARRLEWHFLPPHIRARVEERFGTSVVEAITQPAGFTPGLAAILVGADGRRCFVKAAAGVAQRAFAEAYRVEGQILARLPDAVPAPRLLWTIEEDWVVLGMECLPGRHPTRPWEPTQLEACLDTLESLAAVQLGGVPDEALFEPITAEWAAFPAAWDAVRRGEPQLAHLEEAAELASRLDAALAGQALVHTDIRDDNLLLADDGEIWICDWNWPASGAPWIDTVCLLIQAAGDGLDAEAVLRRRSLTRDVAPIDVDTLLAVVAGYFMAQSALPVPTSSPWLRAHQAQLADATWTWLGTRRSWT